MCKLEVSDSASASASSVVSGGNADSLVCSWLFFNLSGAEEAGVTARRAGQVLCSREHAPGCPGTTPREVPIAAPWRTRGVFPEHTRTARAPTGQPDTLKHSEILHKPTARLQLLGALPTQSLASTLGSLLPTAVSTQPVSCFSDKPNIPRQRGKQLLYLQCCHCPPVPCSDFSTFLASIFQTIIP